MKKFFTRFAAVAMTLVAAFSFVACEEDKVEEVAVSDATVEVAVTAKDAQSATFAITTTKADAVAYYRTTDTKFIATGEFVFKNGKEVEPNTTVSVSMPYLEEMSDYRLCVAARAANGAYTVAYTNVHVPDLPTEVSIKIDEVTYSEATVTVTPDDYTVKYVVGFGPAAATEADFLAGKLQSMEVAGNQAKQIGLQGLQTETEYVVYAQSYNHEGPGSAVVSQKFTTPKGPNVDVNVTITNPIVANFKLTPNEYVGAYSFIFVQKATWEEYKIMMGAEDDESLLQTFYEWYMTTDVMGAEVVEGPVELSGMCGDSYLIGVLVFDTDYNYYGAQFTTFDAPAADPNATEATVEITVGEVTPTSAELSFTMGGGAVGYYCALMTKENYEDIVAKGENNLFNYVYGFGTLLTANDTDNWRVEAGQEYVTVAVPFNVNGVDGFGKMVEARFTAPTEEAATATPVVVKAKTPAYKYVSAEKLAAAKK